MSSKGRGKRRGSARSGGRAKKPNLPSAEGRSVGIQPDEPDNAGNPPTNFVDFEEVLRSADINLTPTHNHETQHQSQETLIAAVQTLQSAPGQNVEAIRCSGDEIFAHVPKSLRQQICKGEYINLALLLKGGMELKDFCSGGSLKLNADGAIEMKSKVCKEKIPTIEKWTDAFLIYSSVYLTAYPDKAAQLLHYMFVIREAAARQKGFCWRDYDEQFRIRQANNLSSWSVINNDLWWRCMQVRETSAGTGDNTVSPKLYTCNDFNRGVCRWPSPCRYPHSCSSCGSAQHGAFACPLKTVSSTPPQLGSSMPFRGTNYRAGFRFQRARGSRFASNFSRGARQRPF